MRQWGTARLLLPAVLAAAAIAATVGACSTGADATLPVLPVASAVPSQAPSQRARAADQRPVQKQPPVIPSTSGESTLERGRTLYGAGCAGCHGQRGEGSGRGPSLIGVGAASIDFQLSSGRMPLNQPVDQPPRAAPAYAPTDIDALVTYVNSLGPGGVPIPQLPPGDTQSGRQLYLFNCASCHASTGVGAALPDGRVAPPVLGVPSTQVAEAIRVGPGLMPQFPPTALTDQQAADIVAYLNALPSVSDHGGRPIGSIGPVTEGFVGWAIGLGLLVVVIRLLGRKAPR